MKKNKISQYNRMRRKFKTGDIVAFQGSDAGSKIIQKATGSIYSHVGLIIRFNDLDRNFILESIPIKGVVLMALSRKLLYFNGKIWWIPLDDKKPNVTVDVRKKIYHSAMDQLGVEYDYNNIVGIGKKILGLISNITENDFNSFICSELVAYAYKAGGIFPKSMVPSETYPAHIANLPVLGNRILLTG